MDDLELNINITGFSAEVKPTVREDNIKAFVTWIFQTESAAVKIYGGTVRIKPFGKDGKLILTYEPPAIKTRGGYIKAMFIEDKILFKRLCAHTIDLYCKLTGEVRGILEDRQILSIESQIRELKEYALKYNLQVVDILIESKSAHYPGREVFDEMLVHIKSGEANGLLVWHANRIARNSKDDGEVI
ncbi:hypothetical protein A3C26_00575 [Candidatus Daviesbacteria bacterium RIFCSPHIGHO2_02_FULL_39_12]|uniref:Resolvase/invertase-type recombinase catalytic domain-containing protein n=1 Tax=Candidatus Daviesbacteria bacterium RIFCSPHIGHO2_02_FULL_39_12 TaxID=1797770 RepID=A0A1F5J9Q4_9BACT|nr:MAG: hypothetical protein A3C26_00575 [Candidatus Daviesbacteria bacterium RIFCSPHIGHO2_02_FULL_39_12]